MCAACTVGANDRNKKQMESQFFIVLLRKGEKLEKVLDSSNMHD